MTYDVLVGGKTYKFNTQKEQEEFINLRYKNHNRTYIGNNIALTSKPDNKPLLNPNKTYNVQLPEVEVTNGQTKILNIGHNDSIISLIFQGNYFGKKFVPTEQNINHYLNLYKGDKLNNEEFAPKEWMKIGGMHLLAGAAIPTIATAPITTAIGAAGGYASDWLWRNYTGKSFGDNVLDWTGLQNYSNPYIDSNMIRDAANALEPLAFFTGGLGADDIARKYIANKLIPRTKNNLAGVAMRFNTTDNVMAPSEDLMFRPVHNILLKDVYYDGVFQDFYGNYHGSPQMSLVGYELGIPQYNMRDLIPYIHRQYITRELAAPIKVSDDYEYAVFRPNEYYEGEYDKFYKPFDENAPYLWYFEDKRPLSVFENSRNTDGSQNFIFSFNALPRSKKKYNKNNYFENSFGVFEPIEKLPEDAIFLYRSPNGRSTYWTKDGILYRDSDHWGDGIKYSSWHLKGDECPGGHCGNTFGDFYLGAIKFSDLKHNNYYSDPNINFASRPIENSNLRNPGPREYSRENSILEGLGDRNFDKLESLSDKLNGLYTKLSETKDPDLIKLLINLLTDEMNTFTYKNPNLSDDSVNVFIRDAKNLYLFYIRLLDELLLDINKNSIKTIQFNNVPGRIRRRIRRTLEAEEPDDDSLPLPKRRKMRKD